MMPSCKWADRCGETVGFYGQLLLTALPPWANCFSLHCLFTWGYSYMQTAYWQTKYHVSVDLVSVAVALVNITRSRGLALCELGG